MNEAVVAAWRFAPLCARARGIRATTCPGRRTSINEAVVAAWRPDPLCARARRRASAR